MVFAREIENRTKQTLTFGVSGKLMLNALVMYDHQTDTLWSQFLGQGVEGPLEGVTLELLPSQVRAWGDWKTTHPNTTALDKGSVPPIGGASYQFGLDRPGDPDAPLRDEELVIGISRDGTQRAYPFRSLQEEPVINDSFVGNPIVVTFDGWSAGAAFSRNVRGQVLTFEAIEKESEAGPLMQDEETGTLWHAMTGQALEGSLKSTRLAHVAVHPSFWFAWSDHYPSTEVYGMP